MTRMWPVNSYSHIGQCIIFSLGPCVLVPLLLGGCTNSAVRDEESVRESVMLHEMPISADLPCSLQFESAGVALHSDIQDAIPDPDWWVARGPGGQYYTATPDGGRILVWTPMGEFGRTIGRPGPGPGELGLGSFPFVGEDGLIHVHETGNGRWSTFDPQGEFLESTTTRHFAYPPISRTVALIDSGRFLMGSPVGGAQFSIVNRDGTVLEFGPATQNERPLTYPGGGTFWAAPAPGSSMDTYDLEEWSLAGELIRVIRRHAPWQNDADTVTSRPDRPTFEIYSGADGHLLLVALVRDPDRTTAAPGELWYEVIDPESPAVIASEQVLIDQHGPPIIGIFPGTNSGFRGRMDSVGLRIIDIMRYNLLPSHGSEDMPDSHACS